LHDATSVRPSAQRLLPFVGLKKGEDFPYQQLYAGVGLGYQWKEITKTHPENIDPDKEHTFVFGGGYERLQTVNSGKTSYENRLALQVVAGFRPASRLLLSDRNRGEFRWVNGAYSTRYRNLVQSEYELSFYGLHFSPYASAEFFYDGATSSWNREWYTAGLEWPYKRIFMVQTYYHLPELESGVDVQQRKRDLAGVERLLREAQHHRGIFPDGIQHRGTGRLRHHFPDDVNAFRFE
jgi:hypothetical protein